MKLIHTAGTIPSFFVIDGQIVLSTGRGSFRKEIVEKLLPSFNISQIGSLLKTPKREFLITPESPTFKGIPQILSEEFQVENTKWINPLYSLPNYKKEDNEKRDSARSFLSQFEGNFVIGGVTYPDNSCAVAFVSNGFGVIPKPFAPLFEFVNGQFQFRYWNGSGLIIASRERDADQTIFRAYEQAL